MDRFMVRLSMGYPDLQSEIAMLKERHAGNPLEEVAQVISREELIQMQQEVEQVFIHDAVYDYIARLVEKTRHQELLLLGISPRGTIALANMGKAAAYLEGRNFVIPDDIKKVFYDVTAHRLLLAPKARVNRVTVEDIIRDIINSVAAPRLVRQRG